MSRSFAIELTEEQIAFLNLYWGNKNGDGRLRKKLQLWADYLINRGMNKMVKEKRNG